MLREYVADESVDLIYLDPPFNSNASYNVLFREKTGEESPAQIKAFTDTWEWTLEAERTYADEIIRNPLASPSVKDMIDDGIETAPSKRIAAEIPAYASVKASAGPLVAERIGLQTMRAKCCHFGEWIRKLEVLAV